MIKFFKGAVQTSNGPRRIAGIEITRPNNRGPLRINREGLRVIEQKEKFRLDFEESFPSIRTKSIKIDPREHSLTPTEFIALLDPILFDRIETVTPSGPTAFDIRKFYNSTGANSSGPYFVDGTIEMYVPVGNNETLSGFISITVIKSPDVDYTVSVNGAALTSGTLFGGNNVNNTVNIDVSNVTGPSGIALALTSTGATIMEPRFIITNSILV